MTLTAIVLPNVPVTPALSLTPHSWSVYSSKNPSYGRAREILSSDSEAQSLEEEIQWPAAWLLLLTECPATALSLTLPRDPSR